MTLIVQIVAILLGGAFFAYGGYKDHNFRRFYMPVILAGACWLLTHSIWSLTVFASSPLMCMGYGEDAPLTHIFNTGWSRSIWGLIVALGASLGLFLTGHMAWYWFSLYLVLGFILDNALKNLWQVSGDLIVGAYVGSLVLMIK